MNIRELQSNLYYILEVVAKILDTHEIKYFLSDGTMLGAVRHNGFIPWDDDIDLTVRRKDYNKILEILSTELNKDVFYIQNYHTDKNFPHTFTRICLINSIGKQNLGSI